MTLETKPCPVCKTDMRVTFYAKNVKSVWSGQEVLLCDRCGHSEDSHGNMIPS